MTVVVAAQAAVTGFIIRYATTVHTNPACHTQWIVRWTGRQAEFYPTDTVDLSSNFQRLLGLPANTRQTEAQGFRDDC